MSNTILSHHPTNQKLANMVHELIDTSSDSGLVEIIKAWTALPEHIKQAIKALIQTNI